MKLRFSPFVLRHFVFLGWLGPVFLSASGGLAQSKPGADHIDSSRQQAVRATTVASAGSFAAGDMVLGEQTLLSLNLNQPGTSDWHLESSQRLVEMAFLLDSRNDHGAAQQLALRALVQLDFAASKGGGTSKTTGLVLAQRGFIQESLLGDSSAALESYLSALRISPDSKRLMDEVKRLEHKVAELKRKKQR